MSLVFMRVKSDGARYPASDMCFTAPVVLASLSRSSRVELLN